MKCFICFNKISYQIAMRVREKNDLIVLRNRRMISQNHDFLNVYIYGFKIKILLIIFSFLGIEIILPHWKESKFLSWIHKFSRRISYLEDGLDTYRTKPKNINLDELRLGVKYYYFNLNIPPEPWVNKLKKFPVLYHKENLVNSDRNWLKMIAEYDCIFIESPGVNLNEYKDLNAVIISHPNKLKREVCDFDRVASNAIHDLEACVSYAQTTVIVGCSFTALLLKTVYALDNLIIHASEQDQKNIPIFKKFFREKK